MFLLLTGCFFIVTLILFFQRASLAVFTLTFTLILLLSTLINGFSMGLGFYWLLSLVIFIPLLIKPLRKQWITRRIFLLYNRVMPTLSATEQEALGAGSVSWEGDLFSGAPDWQKLLAMPKPKLTPEEQAFLDGPTDTLCSMINDWDITHNLMDLPPNLWAFIKQEGFFGLIIPKEYGGKGFSAYAHSQVLIKVSGRSITVASTIAVPNSLGPAELLLHYGTEEQKNYYLPRLATGEAVPCFALTSPHAGSDAAAMTDYGIVAYGDYQGKRTLGIRLAFAKRYITLAPIATVIGLAFKLYDPDHLLSDVEERGITCALIPRNTPGLNIGRRHFPLDTPFQNGPISGQDVFIPLSEIIGGEKEIGNGWRMLMECLANGRAISLPSSTAGGAKALSYAIGAYARVRKQFNVPIGEFEGIQELLARIGGLTYLVDATRTFAVGTLDQGIHSAVAAAIVKYHVTEISRSLAIDGMDILGGKGICLGPNNFLGRFYQSSPIAITVEGANILTRNMIIFGQGAIRCHPYILKEMAAAKLADHQAALNAFDPVILKHIAFAISNTIRSVVLGFSGSHLAKAPSGPLKRYYQLTTRFSAAFALLSEVTMLSLGGTLKRKESISARLGDILSYLYILSAIFKHYHDQGEPMEDLPLIHYACQFSLFEIQKHFADILHNFPNRMLAFTLSMLIFPLGKRLKRPKDKYRAQITELLMNPTAARRRLAEGAYLANTEDNALAALQDALLKSIKAEPFEKTLRSAKKCGDIIGYNEQELAQSALQKEIITKEAFDILIEAYTARDKVIAVDDFTDEVLLGRVSLPFLNYSHYAKTD